MCYVLGKGDSTEQDKSSDGEKIQLFYAHALLSSDCSINQLQADSNILCPTDAWELCQDYSQAAWWLLWQRR